MYNSLIRYNQLQKAKAFIQISIRKKALESSSESWSSLRKLLKGKQIIEETEKAYREKIKMTISHKEIVLSLKQIQEQINKDYLRHFEIACQSFSTHKEAIESMRLAEERKYSFEKWLMQIKDFYLNIYLNTEIQSIIAAKGVSRGDLEEIILKINVFEDAFEESQKRKHSIFEAQTRLQFIFQDFQKWRSELLQLAY